MENETQKNKGRITKFGKAMLGLGALTLGALSIESYLIDRKIDSYVELSGGQKITSACANPSDKLTRLYTLNEVIGLAGEVSGVPDPKTANKLSGSNEDIALRIADEYARREHKHKGYDVKKSERKINIDPIWSKNVGEICVTYR